MELMTKYQYTYFIYPYLIEKDKYKKYLQGLLRNKKCKIRFFDKQKDIHLYTYFLPCVREYMFWSFELSKNGIKDFNSMDTSMQSTLLAQHECNIFNYELPEALQGKVLDNNGIFFEINEIKIICFKTGVCFLVFKTNLENTENFTDVLNFNYKFREINSISYNLKEYENIKIQSSTFKNVEDISALIKKIVGKEDISRKANIGNEKFFVYSYACLDQKHWNENMDNEELDGAFEKYRAVLPANAQMINDRFAMSENNNWKDKKEIYKNQYIKYGFTISSTVLLTSNINTSNYTVVPQKFESEYLYTYIFTLYKKMFLNKLNYEFENKFEAAEKEFLNFTTKVWIQDVTNEEFGRRMEANWAENLELEKTFNKLKNEYDVTYKKYNVEELSKNNKVTFAVVITILVINILTIIFTSLANGG